MRGGYRDYIDGGRKPSVKEPDPQDVTREDIEFVESLSNSEIRSRLSQRGLSDFMVETLIEDRKTNGGRWRIIMELHR